MDPTCLDALAAFLDGFDDEAAHEARELAHDLRAGVIRADEVEFTSDLS
jgi:hypothetical protein